MPGDAGIASIANALDFIGVNEKIAGRADGRGGTGKLKGTQHRPNGRRAENELPPTLKLWRTGRRR